MTISITVSGSAEATYPPERARVTLAIAATRSDRDTATNDVAKVQTRLRGELTELESSGTITEWASGSVSSYSFRPRDNKGKELAPEHVARVSVEATFADLEAISPAVDRWLRDPLISMNHIHWHLTRESRHQRAAEVRRTAVEDAVEKAQGYADALGAGQVEPAEIADEGMLAQTEQFGGPVQAYAMAAPAGMPRGAEGETIELSPKDITLQVSVDARFTAERP